METTIKSRNLGKDVTFSRPGSSYIRVDLNDQPGTLGLQICHGGRTTGSTVEYEGDDQKQFDKICKNWFRAYLASNN